MRTGRKCHTDTVWFKRKLSDPDRETLLCAGSGDISTGFMEMLMIYQFIWSQGFRPEMDISCIRVDLGTGNKENAL